MQGDSCFKEIFCRSQFRMTWIVALVFIYLATCKTLVYASLEAEAQNEQGCFSDCPPIIPDPTDDEIKTKSVIKLHCRTDSSIVISFPATEYNETEYRVEYQINERRFSRIWEEITIQKKKNQTHQNIVAIEKLRGSYLFRITAYKDRRPVGEVMLSPMLSTLTPTMPLSNIKSVNITNFTVTAEKLRVSTQLIWKPIKELVCGYQVTLWKVNLHTVDEIIPAVDQLYNMTLQNLNYSSLYQIHLAAKTSWGDTDEYLLSFNTPTCYEMNNYDTNLCAPDPPKNMRLKYTPCKIIISWEKPVKQPDFYMVTIKTHENRAAPKLRIVGTSLGITLDTNDFGAKYEVQIVSLVNEKPSLEVAWEEKNTCPKVATAGHPIIFVLGGAAFLLGIIILWCLSIVIPALCCHCREEDDRNDEIDLKELEDMADLFRERLEVISEEPGKEEEEEDPSEVPFEECIYIEPEVPDNPPEIVDVKEVIGSGEFGVVRKGFLRNEHGTTIVAVKKLTKKAANSSQEDLLSKEAEVMVTLGQHTNVLQMIKHVAGSKVLLLEYCALGNLLNFLRDTRKTMLKVNNLTNNEPSTSRGEEVISNLTYGLTELENRQMNLTTDEIMMIGKQIASGMQYLELHKIVHRDLAARNVLLTDKFVPKISDFGLSRDIYVESVYKMKRGVSMLPVKWLAPECLMFETFTSKSDAWSFGVLMWECFTLGGVPYPALSPREAVALLNTGYRLEQPKSCPDDMYEIMMDCWKTNELHRPTFAEIKSQMETILGKDSIYGALRVQDIDYTHSPNDITEYLKKSDSFEFKKELIAFNKNRDVSL